MLRDLDLNKYTKVYIACGYTDLRLGINGLTKLVEHRFGLDYYDQSALFLFMGRSNSTLKALCFEGDGHVLLTKRLIRGRFQWPRTEAEARLLAPTEVRMLLAGFSIESTIPNDSHAAG